MIESVRPAGGAALHFATNSTRYSDAETFARERPPEESGCLYYSTQRGRFVVPGSGTSLADQNIVPHFGAPGGVVPRMTDTRIEGTDI